LQAAIDALRAFPLADKSFAKARQADLALLAAGDWQEFIGKGIASKLLAGETIYYRKPIPPDLIAAYEPLLQQARSVLVGQIAQQTEATHRLLSRFAEQYGALQSQQRALRFDDVTHRLAVAAGTAGASQWAFRLGGAVEHLLLDEFQDTSPVQWQVLRPLAQQLTHGSPHAPREANTSFFCVGDTKQAIYGWRGGLAEIFDALDGELAGLAKDTLAKSYRSSPPVIQAVNQVFSRLTQHPSLDKLQDGVSLWQQQFPEHSTAKSELPGYVRLEFAPPAGAAARTRSRWSTWDRRPSRCATTAGSSPSCCRVARAIGQPAGTEQGPP
jgi:ATP-dependent exoDNAse (exonuclease V) beta subunit